MRSERYCLTSKPVSQASRLSGQPWPNKAVSICLSLSIGLFSSIPAVAATPAKPAARTLAKAPATSSQSLEATIDKAQAYAQQEKFGEAIPLYEQILKQLQPTDSNYKVLSRNLEVLYANHAVTLIGQKQYDKAETTLKTARTKYPNNSHITQTLSTLYFRQAMDLRDDGQANPDHQNFEKIEQLIKQAIALSPNDSNYKRGLAANYFDNGLAFAHEQKLEDAVPLLEAAQKLQPTSDNIKESLVNVYLSLMHQESDTIKQKAWADKALALDNSPQTQAMVQQVLNPPSAVDITAADPKNGGIPTTEKKRPHMPASGSKLSIQDMMLDIENQWGIERDPKAKLQERLAFAEKQVNGKESEGPLATRIQDLYAQLYGQQQQDTNTVAGPLNLTEDVLKTTYIGEVFKMTDGKVIRFGKFPVRVFIEEPDEKANAKDLGGLYKPEYKQAVLDGIGRWKEVSQGSISFVEVKNMSAADIIFDFNKAYIDRFADPDKVPDWYKSYSAPKVNNKMMTAVRLASMFTPGFFSLIPMVVGSGMQYQQFKKLEVIRDESTVHLGLEPVSKLPDEQGVMLLQNIAAKEFGHALGIKATSPDPKDLMYPDLVSDHAKFPTNRDMATLNQIYTRPANILLNVQSQITGKY